VDPQDSGVGDSEQTGQDFPLKRILDSKYLYTASLSTHDAFDEDDEMNDTHDETWYANQLATHAEALAGQGDVSARLSALVLTARAAELKLIQRLGPVLEQFPVTIQEHFARPSEPAVSVQDAFVDPATPVHLLDLLELASDPALSCIAPRLYRGWQDRVLARRDARRITGEAVGFSLAAAERDTLLMAVALRNRLLLTPPPLEVDETQVDEALAAVRGLLERLST